MNKKTKLLPILISPFLLTSCGKVVNYEEGDNWKNYVFTMQYKENFNILQLTDIHWNINSSTYESKRYMDKVLAEADRELRSRGQKIDLVELTGDMFMLSNSFEVTDFVKYFEKKSAPVAEGGYDFKYAVIWGNHDRHGLYHPNWLANQFRKAKNCFYFEPNDNVYGRSNFVINLMDGTRVKWQIANLDSGASFSESPMSPFRDYDYIREDQIKWWEKEHDEANNTIPGRTTEQVPGIAYYHIPQDENLKLYEGRSTLKNKFFKLEDFADNGNEEYASNFLDRARTQGLKGAFMGHAHNVDWTVQDTDGLIVGLGVKTGIELYYAHIDVDSTDPAMHEGVQSVLSSLPADTKNFDLIGASLVTIKDDANFDLEHLYLNERESGDFVRWVRW